MSTGERLHDGHGNIKVTCPHGCGMLIWHGQHDRGRCPGQPDAPGYAAAMRRLETEGERP